MSKISANYRSIRSSIQVVMTLLLISAFLFHNVAGESYMTMMMEDNVLVNSPPVILQNGTAGTSTIYTNKTSAKVSVEAPLFDYVDNNDTDVDSSPDEGIHSNFTAQQAGPDSIYDTFTEENTGEITKVGTDTSGTGNNLTLSFSHTLVSGTNRIVIVSIGAENGNTTDVSTVTYGGVTMTLAVERITGTSGFRYLCEIWYILENDLPSDGSQTVEINCSGIANELEVNGFCSEYTGVTQGAPEATDGAAQFSGNTISNTISPSDDAWVISIAGSGNVGSFTHGEGQVEVLDFQDASSTFAVAELRVASGETVISSTYSGTVNRLCRVAASWTERARYELDLEVQWTSADYTRTNEELCIRTGTFSGSENIQVKVWNSTGSSWHWVMNLTASQWNNVSITPYLTSSTFTVQFLGGTETGDTTQDSWNIDTTLLHVWTITPTWLSGWDKRAKIIIDYNDVDDVLSDFPAMVYLSNSSGRNDDDVSFIFDELQSDANRKKIAVATSDGTTQCYVEIEKWDNTNQKAWLWVRVPSISNAIHTELYLYYDKDHADNTVYVGDTGSTAAQNVWDSSFKGVWHLGETSGGTGAIQDSTSNNNVGTDNGSPTFNATGLIDSAISFDGIDDYINMSNSASLQFTSSLTIEAWVNLQSFGSGSDVDVVLRKGEGNPNDYQLAIHDQKLALMIEEGDASGLESSATLTATTWYYLTGTWNGSMRRVYLNGSEDGSGSKTGNIIPDTRDIYIGGRSGTDLSTGVIDEVRASNTTRSAAWIKASYESGRDDLIDFAEEGEGTYDYVLRVNNSVADSWQIRLKKYYDSNINRLPNCIIYFHNSTNGTSTQVYIQNGVYINQTGPWYDLGDSETIFIAMTIQANTAATSYVYAYLEIRIPGTTTYIQYMIAFEIT